MKLKFKRHPYQDRAVESVVDGFEGQPKIEGRIGSMNPGGKMQMSAFDRAIGNADFVLDEDEILKNVRKVQRRQGLSVSKSLSDFAVADRKGNDKPVNAAYEKKALEAASVHLDIEMETGTGKTYCYIKTMFELNRRYGWSKFIVMTPSVAIREGARKSFEITADHFVEAYGKRARFFIYDSRRLHQLDGFACDAGIQAMIINIQAFNARGADNRRIYEERDDFQSRKPIDVIAAARPILILDEPQKMEGDATMEALPKFNPLFILRYSATHRTRHCKIHRLDAIDAYNEKLVKKIEAIGIRMLNLSGTNAYLYLESIDVSEKAPVAQIEMEKKLKSGEIKREVRRLSYRDDLFVKSDELPAYRGFVISQIDANGGRVEFKNGEVLKIGDVVGDMSEMDFRRIQIREAIRAHLGREKRLFAEGIKVLSLFFIDEVAKYRDYERDDEKGDYARIFEEEYDRLKDEYLSELALKNRTYRSFLDEIETSKTHNGYFAIDKKTKRLKDPTLRVRTGESDDVDAYDLILKDKERLLSFDEPTRFIFSHSALREGWDNPNVFTICMLKHSGNDVSRRQEVGRGLRLCVNRHGDRIDDPVAAHETNILTVVANENYEDFAAGLQTEIRETLSARPRKATAAYFEGKTIDADERRIEKAVDKAAANKIHRYLIRNCYIDDNDHIAQAYRDARDEGSEAPLPEELEPFRDSIFRLIDSVFNDAQIPKIEDGRRRRINPRNDDNFKKKEFEELWNRINRKASYRVDFCSEELIENCARALEKDLKIAPMRYEIKIGREADNLTLDKLRDNQGFTIDSSRTEDGDSSHSNVKYDLIGEAAKKTRLTRKTTARILEKIAPDVFAGFKRNPERFIVEFSRIVEEQKATTLVERLTYHALDERCDVDIFTKNQMAQDVSMDKLKKHIYDYVVTDSKIERKFAEELDGSEEVAVYAKLPRGFAIPTPLGKYNPDWAIAFKAGSVKHIYFVAETKGSMSTMELRRAEEAKIECARKFFAKISEDIMENKVKYDVVESYDRLLDIVKGDENPAQADHGLTPERRG